MLLTFSAAGFSVESALPKQEFLANFSIIENANDIIIKEKFGSYSSIKAVSGLKFTGKVDKHFNTSYKIINSTEDRLEIEFTKASDQRSFGSELSKETGIFYVTYK